jgi:hypothetical protein
MGHPTAKPTSAEAALGQPQRPETIFRCFNCHATNVKPDDLSALTPGIQCERCHGSAALHLASPSRTNIRRDASVGACAECHRMPPSERKPAPERDDPMSIRFAPVGLSASRCFQQSNGAVSCVTCHDPHAGGAAAGGYDNACKGCHATPGTHRSPPSGNCVSCHMPKATPLPGLTFTDHRIR